MVWLVVASLPNSKLVPTPAPASEHNVGLGDITKSAEDLDLLLWTNLLKTASAGKAFFIFYWLPWLLQNSHFFKKTQNWRLKVTLTFVFNYSTLISANWDYQWLSSFWDSDLRKYFIANDCFCFEVIDYHWKTTSENLNSYFILSDDATLIMVNLFIRSFAKIDDVKMEYSVQITFR